MLVFWHVICLTLGDTSRLHGAQGLEEKLRSLDAFLGDHQQRVRGTRRTRPAPSGGFFMDPASRLAGRDASGPAAKRPRVEEAVKQEDQRHA